VLDEAGSAAAAEAAASLKGAGLGEAGWAAAAEAAASRKSAGLGGAGLAAAAEAAASRKSAVLGGAGLAAAAEAAASRKSAGLGGAGSAAASAAAAARGDAGFDDAGSAVVKAVDRAKEGAQLEVVAPPPQLLVLEPLTWAECAPPTDTGRMARIGDDLRRRPACVGTYGRTAAVRAGAPFLRSDAARDEPCCRNGRSFRSPTPSPPAANRPLLSTVLLGSEKKAAACAQSGRHRGEAARLPPQPRPRTVVCQRWHREETTAKRSALAQTVPPRPPNTTAVAQKRGNTHVLPPVMQCGRQRRWRPLQSTRARRLHSRVVTAAAGDDGGRRHARGCARHLSRRKTGHGAGANAPGSATPPTNGPKNRSAANATVPDDPAAPPPYHCVDDLTGARKPPARPFSTVSQVARPLRTPPKQAAALDHPLARGESGGHLCCLSRSGPIRPRRA